MERYEVNKNVNLELGLSSSQVSERVKNKLENKTYTKTSKTYLQIFVSNIFTWFNIICFLIAGVLIAVGSFENITFLLIFTANLLIGLIQEIRAKRMVDNISVIYSNQVEVLRDGQRQKIKLESVVVDDIFYIKNGDQVCCDCVIIDGNVEVNESLLTGESKAIKKTNGDTLLGGSFLVSGSCKVMAVKVGLETYSSKLIRKARELKSNQSDILKTLNFIIKSIGIIIVPLGILTFFDLKANHDIVYAIEKTSGSVIGMMPVGMFLLTSVSLVVGVINLAKHKTLVQNLYSIEMLARANVLCLDKTGTLTDGTMSIKSVLPLKSKTDEIYKIMQSYVRANKTENSTSKALASYFWAEEKDIEKPLNLVEFSSERKFSAVEFKNLGTFMLGAPEFVTNKLDDEIRATIKDFTKEGYRVLLLCKSRAKNISEKISKNNTPMALITIEDNIRPDAKSTIEWFNNNDVEIKIISGDNVDTVSNISRKVGIKNYDKCISLEKLSDEEVEKVANEYTVFGRVTPEQKAIIVKALRKNGNKVAMTGDGVNDILALKESDCSIAMASGSEATRSSSNLIMLENNFSAMPCIVAEGRRVINNISKASSLFLTKTFFSIFLTIFVIISTKYEYPLQPNQILLWETLFIGIPAFFLALQPNKDRIKGSFLASLSSKALPGAIVLFLSTIACYIYCNIINMEELIPTLISYSVTFGAFFILLNLCQPFDKYRTIMLFSLLGVCILGFVIISNDFFNYSSLTLANYGFLIGNLVFIYLSYLLLKFVFEKIFITIKNNKKQKSKENN